MDTCSTCERPVGCDGVCDDGTWYCWRCYSDTMLRHDGGCECQDCTVCAIPQIVGSHEQELSERISGRKKITRSNEYCGSCARPLNLLETVWWYREQWACSDCLIDSPREKFERQLFLAAFRGPRGPLNP